MKDTPSETGCRNPLGALLGRGSPDGLALYYEAIASSFSRPLVSLFDNSNEIDETSIKQRVRASGYHCQILTRDGGQAVNIFSGCGSVQHTERGRECNMPEMPGSAAKRAARNRGRSEAEAVPYIARDRPSEVFGRNGGKK